MGNHYVPKRYLRNFESPGKPGWIWQYDQVSGESRHLPIDSVAQARGFYDADVERSLNTDVEIPAHSAMDRLCGGLPLGDSDRIQVSLYVGTMLKRVPDRRNRAIRDIAPRALDDIADQLRREILRVGQELAADPAIVLQRLTDVEALQKKFRADLPVEVWGVIRNPLPPKTIVDAIYSMYWRVLAASGPSWFMTSDNPVFFHRSVGLTNAQSELCWPLATGRVLYASRRPGEDRLMFGRADERLVRNINRRTADGVTRVAFYHEEAPWISRMLEKNRAPHPGV